VVRRRGDDAAEVGVDRGERLTGMSEARGQR
jgi:hypothetical protein